MRLDFHNNKISNFEVFELHNLLLTFQTHYDM